MRIEIKTDVFNDDSKFDEIDQIFYFIQNRKHDLYLDNEEDLISILESNFITNHISDSRATKLFNEIFEKALVESDKPSPFGKITLNNDYQFNSVFERLKQPLHILVENAKSDGALIIALAKIYKRTGKKILTGIEKNWIHIEQAGGATELSKRIEANYGANLRIFTLVDSDKKFADDNYSTSATAVIETTDRLGISKQHHVLYKREIENYIPIEALKQLPEKLLKTAEAYTSLSEEQQDFYDLEKGFNDKSKPQENQAILFDGLSEENINKLRKGFVLEDYDAKNELYKLFNTPLTNQSTLESRCRHQRDPLELKGILNKINAIL